MRRRLSLQTPWTIRRMPIGPKRSFVTVTEERQMIPASNHAVWTQIATGAKTINSGKLAINLLVQANKLSYESDRSPANVKQLAAKTYSFFVQFEKLFRTNWPRLSSNPSRIRSLGNYARNRQFNIAIRPEVQSAIAAGESLFWPVAERL